MEQSDATLDVDRAYESPAKKLKRDEDHEPASSGKLPNPGSRMKGAAPIKTEFLVHVSATNQERASKPDDDDAEAAGYAAQNDNHASGRQKTKKRGQNTNRDFGSSRDALQLCSSRVMSSEFSPEECKFGSKCRNEHDLRKYLREGKRPDLCTFDGMCPAFGALGFCSYGWKCRFVGSHSDEREIAGGEKELVLLGDTDTKQNASVNQPESKGGSAEVVNTISAGRRIDLQKKRAKTPKSDTYIQWLSALSTENEKRNGRHRVSTSNNDNTISQTDHKDSIASTDTKVEVEDGRTSYTEAPLRPSEKRRLYYGPETPILAPLTTQGNLPFRRLCVELGAQITWSEMAMGLPLVQGEKSEWALLRAHKSETSSPRYLGKNAAVKGYENPKDLKFGAQIAAHKPWLAVKATEILTALCPHLRAIDLNCGCPIDLVYRQGAGSALLDAPGKLEKILRGMNAVSEEVPITVKVRMGTKDNDPTADKLVKRLVLGGLEAVEAGEGPAGVAAITLHGRSRQQRYSRQADWSYIAHCAATIKRLNDEKNKRADTMAEADPRDLANDGHVYFVGNGDCYSYEDYYQHIREGQVDTVMVARGALIKPWIFEEIEKGQYLDKSASERLEYIEKFAKYGLQVWGSDEIGVGTTRRFLLEWLSFSCRYIPIGLLEHMPPRINDRPPAYRGRSDLETLLSSNNFRDWIKLSEMFLGPAHPNFKFEPKHKSSSYEIEAEG